jgi:hypothetical protein
VTHCAASWSTALLLATLLTAPALAGECVELSEQMAGAWAAFNDAELEQADALIELAHEQILCQGRLITADELLALYELDALVSLAMDDQDGAVFAVIRTVTADPTRTPDPAHGPKLADLHQTWRRRLDAARLTLRVEGDTPLHLDGRPVEPGTTVQTLEGTHLLQWQGDSGLYTELRELIGDQTLFTSPPDVIDGTPVTAPAIEGEPVPVEPRRKRRAPGRPAIWGTGLGLAALGGGAVLAGYFIQERFEANPYDDATYGGCNRGQGCYTDEREQLIQRDATLIRALYAGGYGLAGIGVVLTGVGFGVQPKPGGAELAVAIRLP